MIRISVKTAIYRPAFAVTRHTTLDGAVHRPGDRYVVLGTAEGGYVRLARVSDGKRLNAHPSCLVFQ